MLPNDKGPIAAPRVSRLRNLALAVAVALACGASAEAARNDIFMIGPMVHVNLTKAGTPAWSFALEGSYWAYDDAPVGVDVGLEYDLQRGVRLYSELETGFFLGGLAVGPALQFGSGGASFGFQCSLWLNYFAGVDIRFRQMMDEPMVTAPGFYAKAPTEPPKYRQAESKLE